MMRRTRGAHRGATAATGTQRGIDDDAVLHAANCRGGANVDTFAASGLALTMMRATRLTIFQITRPLEFADHAEQAARGLALFQRISTRSQIAIGQMRQTDQRLAREIENQIEAFLTHRGIGGGVEARKIDGTNVATGLDAIAMLRAACGVVQHAGVDHLHGTFRARPHAGTAADAAIQIDRRSMPPAHVEGTQMPAHMHLAAIPHGEFTARRQPGIVRDERGNIEVVHQTLRPVERGSGGADDE